MSRSSRILTPIRRSMSSSSTGLGKTAGKSVLISGGGIAGPAIAWWLYRYGFKTTLVERWHEVRAGGQGIDVNDEGREVATKMNILSTILASNTGEKGTILTNYKGDVKVNMPLVPGEMSFTNDSEILRGTFAKLLYDITHKNTDWRFNDQITSLNEGEEGVKVGFQSGKEEMFDLVVIADGVGSRTRKLAFPGDQIQVKTLGSYIAYFTMLLDPNEPYSDQWVVTHLPGRRVLSYRPDGIGNATAFLMWLSPTPKGYEKLSLPEQISAIRRDVLLAGPDLDSPIVARADKGLSEAKDIYIEYSAQIKAQTLYTPGGKIGMIGDAAYCGTAFTGAGTTLSLVGAYILAGELAKHAGDTKAGFEGYEEFMAPFAKKCQELVPGLPGIALPESEMGIRLLHGIIGIIAWLSRRWIVKRLMGAMGGEEARKALPDYSKYEVHDD